MCTLLWTKKRASAFIYFPVWNGKEGEFLQCQAVETFNTKFIFFHGRDSKWNLYAFYFLTAFVLTANSIFLLPQLKTRFHVRFQEQKEIFFSKRFSTTTRLYSVQIILFKLYIYIFGSFIKHMYRHSAVGTASGYGLDGRGVEVRVPTGLSPMVKRPWPKTYYSPPASAEVKKMWIYTSIPAYAFMA
jgi:hypothetical protein